jgi:hypothetical protein
VATGAGEREPHQAKGSGRSPPYPLAALGSLWSCPRPGSPRCHVPHPWRTTEELCQELAISRSTLFALRKSGLLKPGRHLVPKNPACSRSRLLWLLQRCELALGRLP